MAAKKTSSGSKKRASAKRTKKRSTSPARKSTSRKTTATRSRKSPKKATQRRRPTRKARTTSAMPGWLKVLGSFVTRVAGIAFIGTIASMFVIYWFAQDLPPVRNLEVARVQPRITVLDRNGIEIGVHGQDRGQPVSASNLPEHVIQAFIATEDRTFFHHVGVNPVAILRALTVNVQEGQVAQGGSTITQQLVKNLLLTPEQTVQRKAQEILLALKIEMLYSKDEILSLYLNRVYFGNGAYGIEAASRRYFSKSPQELTVGEAAMLAGLLKAPSKYSPKANEIRARDRAKTVLVAMVDAGFIDAAEVKSIEAAGIAHVVADDRRLDYAVDHAVAEARQHLGDIEQDVVIRTTIDSWLTRSTVAARGQIAAEDPLYTKEVQTAALALEENGAIRVMIGGNDYQTSVYNRATQALRQPGSVFKTFVYLAAIENGWFPEDEIDDSRITIGDYSPTNYKDRYYDHPSLTEALSRSLNAAAIRLQESVGRGKVVEVARRAGLSHVTDVGPSLGLGVMEATPLDVAKSFLPFSNGGYAATPYIVDQVEDADGTVLYLHPVWEGERKLFSDETLVAFDHMMRAVIATGSGRRAQIPGHYAAGKTGTSQNSRDAWFAGYASGMVGIVWLGKDDDTPMKSGSRAISGSHAPAELWGAMMTKALENRPPRFPEPYFPQPKSQNLFDHLSRILGGGRKKEKRVEPEPADQLSQLLNDVAMED